MQRVNDVDQMITAELKLVLDSCVVQDAEAYSHTVPLLVEGQAGAVCMMAGVDAVFPDEGLDGREQGRLEDADDVDVRGLPAISQQNRDVRGERKTIISPAMSLVLAQMAQEDEEGEDEKEESSGIRRDTSVWKDLLVAEEVLAPTLSQMLQARLPSPAPSERSYMHLHIHVYTCTHMFLYIRLCI